MIGKCEKCKENESTWAVREIEGEVNVYMHGWHILGFPIIMICDKCLENVKDEIEKNQIKEE